VPVPSNLGPNDVAVYSLDPVANQWVSPVAPSSVTNGTATFAVTHFSDEALVQRNVGDGEVTTSVPSAGPTYVIGGSVPVPIVPGQHIPMGATIDTAGQVVCSRGVVCGGNDGACGDSQIHYYQVCRSIGIATIARAAGVSQTQQIEPTSSASWTELHMQYVDDPGSTPPAGATSKHVIRTKTDALGIRGTIATCDFDPCGWSSSGEQDDLEVDEGEVDVTDMSGTTDVFAGQEADECEGCNAGPRSTCCEPTSLANLLNIDSGMLAALPESVRESCPQ
jgi:hypothetical protein